MAYYGDADIDTMLAEFGVPVVFTSGGTTYTGIGVLDVSDEDPYDVDAMSIAAKVKPLLVKTSSWPGLAAGSQITVDGVSCTVTQIRQQGDGALTRAYCATV